MHNQVLFCDRRLYDFLSRREADAANEIDGYEPDYILKSNIEDLKSYLFSKYNLSLPNLHTDKIYVVDHGERKSKAYGTEIISNGNPLYRIIRTTNANSTNGETYVDFAIPFDGSEEIFMLQPSHNPHALQLV